MHSVMQNGWNASPLWLVAALLITIEEVGLARLMARSSPKRARAWRWRGLAYDLSLVAICVIDSSPLMGLSMKRLAVHMVIHVVEMFYIPIVLVLSAPWLPALFSLPVTIRRRTIRWWQLGAMRSVTRALSGLITAPLVAVVAFNGVMVFWHIPRFFDWAMWNPWVHTWLMGPSFVLAGYLFWRVILGSHPYGPRGSTRFQVFTIVVTAFSMVIIAMAMSIFAHHAWYSMNIAMLGPTAAFHDQQIAAGVLWICGDFWFVPALVLIVRRLIDESGGVEQAFERALGRGELVNP
jgi:cytochrome c oxidase assembly factor CtaG